MQKQLLSMVITAIVVMSSFSSSIALAAKPTTSAIDHGPTTIRYSGDSASLFLYGMIDGCIMTDVQLMASTQTAKSSSGESSTRQVATIFINRYDQCNDNWLNSLFGDTSLDSSNYQFDKQLNSAHLNTIIPMYDSNGNISPSILVDLTWTGVGDLTQGKSRDQVQSPNCKVTTTVTGRTRVAAVAGVISDDANNYMDGEITSATLQSVKSGETTIGCSN